MGSQKRKQTSRLVRQLFAILMDHPDGVDLALVMDNLVTESNGERPQIYDAVMRGCVAPIKAGWLSNDTRRLTVLPQGRIAFQNYSDPEDFMAQAGRLSVRGWMSVHFPEVYFPLGKLRDRFSSEYRVFKRIGVKTLLGKAVGSQAEWQEVLPIQTCRRINIPDQKLGSIEELIGELNQLNLNHGEGGHALYLSPEALRNTAFKALANFYPANSGLKILKHPGGIAESVYVSPNAGESLLHLKLIHNVRHLTLVANLLNVKGVGPMLHDLVEIECGNKLWTAFVVEHAGTKLTSDSECTAGIQRIRELEEKGLVKVVLPLGFNDPEFECPDCSGNAFITADGDFRYVDFQNFALINYGDYLKSVALEAADASHFGDKSFLRGGRYLYQSVPGVKLPGKRSVEDRVPVLRKLMEAAGVSVQDRLVLDVGCNIGMMMGEYLGMGALWCHGWDKPAVVPHTAKLLRALGCTRFSTTGTDITKSRSLEDDLPKFLADHIEGCAISYLAVRGHIDWLDSLARIPWGFLIYEGHEGETREEFSYHLEQLKKVLPVKVAASDEYADGDSEPRTVAILART
jgi:hypothetical protein